MAAQHAMWSAGDFSVIGLDLVLASEWLCEAVGLRAGERVLDVATGTGNTALAAARRRCDVTGIDIVPASLERAALRATAEGVTLDLHVGDAQHLPVQDAGFDAVLSTFGVMFAPDAQRATDELLRVCRPKGRIGLACWRPDGFIAEFLQATARFSPPPPGTESPTRWGTRDFVATRLGDSATVVSAVERTLLRRWRSPSQYLDEHRRCFGPTVRAFERLDAEGTAALARALLDAAERHDRSDDGSLLLPCDYLEVVAVKA